MKLFPIGLYCVKGQSMLPKFPPGTILLGSHWWPPLKAGLVVAVKRPECLIIKRISKIDASGLWLEGDNPGSSTDSRQFGYVSAKDVVAVMIMPLWRPFH